MEEMQMMEEMEEMQMMEEMEEMQMKKDKYDVTNMKLNNFSLLSDL
jgi:hypothetical protein